MPRDLAPAIASLEKTKPAEAERITATRKADYGKTPRAGHATAAGRRRYALHWVCSYGDPDLAALLLMADMGTTDYSFFRGAERAGCNSVGSHKRQVDQEASNFALSVIRGVEPRDQVEAMLAAQMAAVHMATMMLARRLNHVETIPQQDAAERALNKLARTFSTQVEALKRYRTGGTQKVTVEHVTVSAGGQAIVGNVAHGGGGGT
jgi:hypothetical protein